MTQNTLPVALTACLFLFGVTQAFITLSKKPAFNETLQVETVTGGGRPLAVSSMYSEADYLFQVAAGYQGVSGVEILQSGGEILPDASVIQKRMEISRDALLRGLQLAPGNVSSWMSLARAEEALGNRTGAVHAILATVSIAPGNFNASRQRILSYASYAAAEGPEWVLDHPKLKRALIGDLDILRRHGRQVISFIDVIPNGPEALSWLENQENA
ncbi:MAG: hypothetical protein AB8B94_16585 [Hyphomicrobiales bacterium]